MQKSMCLAKLLDQGDKQMKAQPKAKALVGFALGLMMAAGVCRAAWAESGGDLGEGEPKEGAKGLFFQQLERPTQKLNTGLSYWIELKRGKSVQRVTNKTQFKTGDSIRFHVRSNIDGYAYILLSCGSRQEKSVLFPDERMGERNHIEAGKEYTLPSDGYLTFDENPGTERLTLLLSRNEMNAEAYLQGPRRNGVAMIASNMTGSKDLVPAKIYVSYNTPRIDSAPVARSEEPKAEPTKVPEKKVEKKVVAKNNTKKNESKKEDDSKSKAATLKTSSGNGGVHRTPAPSVAPKDADEGTTTIVSKESTGILHVDVDLLHQDK